MALRDGVILLVSAALVLALGGCSGTGPGGGATWLVDPKDYNDKVEQLKQAQATLGYANQQVYRLRKEKQEISAALAEAEEKVKNVECNLALTQKSLAEAQKKLADLQEARSDNTAIKTELAQAMKELSDTRSAAETSRADAANEANRARKLEEQVADLKKQVETLEVKLGKVPEGASKPPEAPGGGAP